MRFFSFFCREPGLTLPQKESLIARFSKNNRPGMLIEVTEPELKWIGSPECLKMQRLAKRLGLQILGTTGKNYS